MPGRAPVVIRIRHIHEADLDSLNHLQVLAYGYDFLESSNVILDKIRQGKETSFVAEQTLHGHSSLVGYCLSHAYDPQQVPPLNSLLNSAQLTSSRHWYIHDLSLDPAARGQGIARALLDAVYAEKAVQHCQTIALVAVQNSVSFWQKQGFVVTEEQPEVSSYGEDARYMVKVLAPD
ncbi:MAG: N-acetyltransferase [Thiomicrorhabdus chilensis]|uniref:GNAT family N-acetyltransferase n=1 Tax=Thiomicrorhabdus chilensis TaxID=63656 RepID=UPI00299EC726|nr:N-acetyltransferase [Thiomicrorhabdus chilensis]MDX1348569.1 N-acetyltransferase [Thiomicrorhabdus chilensis]